jgi:VEFS-Box of polycomb protein
MCNEFIQCEALLLLNETVFASKLSHLQALFDMTDISTTEKLFMTLWNNFMRSHPILSEIQLSSQLLSFVQEHSNVLLQCDLEEELMGHLVNMWAEGHIGQGTMLEAMKIFNSYANER